MSRKGKARNNMNSELEGETRPADVRRCCKAKWSWCLYLEKASEWEKKKNLQTSSGAESVAIKIEFVFYRRALVYFFFRVMCCIGLLLSPSTSNERARKSLLRDLPFPSRGFFHASRQVIVWQLLVRLMNLRHCEKVLAAEPWWWAETNNNSQ